MLGILVFYYCLGNYLIAFWENVSMFAWIWLLLVIALQLVALVLIFLWQPPRMMATVILAVVVLVTGFLTPWSLLLGIPLLVAALVIAIDTLRQNWIIKPAYHHLSTAMPPMSDTEKEALDAGSSWWEKELFMGKPDWQTFANYPYPTLTAQEQAFLDNEVNTLCAMVDEWQINQNKGLSDDAWQYIKSQGFLGLIIPKEYGGLAFSAYAQSRVMSKIASRSVTTAVTCMVPNSLGPGELLMKYGTDEQKNRWLPGLAKGKEIPCFGLTGPEAGSDAGAIPDTGVVGFGEYQGKQVLGLTMNFSKRWITLAPIATVVGLAFKLYDPDGLLPKYCAKELGIDADGIDTDDIHHTDKAHKVDYGITCALIPADHEGVVIGGRHSPSGSPFMNGTVTGSHVFIPLDFIIGGVKNAGKGWRMLMECLGVGRGISLPALSTANAEMVYLTTGAFAKVREQFKVCVGEFEGVQEVSSDIAANAYLLEAFRHLVTCGLDQGGTPSVMTAMAKYHATETMRVSTNHAMDIVGGRGIQQGPRNFLANIYQSIPVAITVEGANILTRSLMIFGQGAMRCHPYLYDELQLLQTKPTDKILADFDKLLTQHLSYSANRAATAFVAGLFGGANDSPPFADHFSKPYYRHINRLSAVFATTADMALGILAGDLKRKEMLSGRLADIHSQLFMMTAVLQFYAHGSQSQSEQQHAKLALDNALYAIQEACFDLFANFPNRLPATLVKLLTFPLGRSFAKPTDEQRRQLGSLWLTDADDNPFRQQLKTMVYYQTDADDVTGRLENAYQKLLAIEPLWKRFKKAESKGQFTGISFEDHVVAAVQTGFISEEESEALIDYNGLRFDSLLTDVFDETLTQVQYRHNPHSPENAINNLTAYMKRTMGNLQATTSPQITDPNSPVLDVHDGTSMASNQPPSQPPSQPMPQAPQAQPPIQTQQALLHSQQTTSASFDHSLTSNNDDNDGNDNHHINHNDLGNTTVVLTDDPSLTDYAHQIIDEPAIDEPTIDEPKSSQDNEHINSPLSEREMDAVDILNMRMRQRRNKRSQD